jgi:hypothetical protein
MPRDRIGHAEESARKIGRHVDKDDADDQSHC